MPEALPTFSESWYRIAGQQVHLRPAVIVRRQHFRGERWYVLENPFDNQFFRLRPEAYEFVARLRPGRTVQEVWQECLERFPDKAPGQEAVLQLLSQLYHANLLHYDSAADSAQLFQRHRKRRQREITARFLNLMFMRFPILDPDRFLVKTMPLVRRLISPMGALLWLFAVGVGVKIAIDNFPALRDQGQSILAPGNIPLLYLGLVLLKTLHEFGHAYFCRRFGGEVHVMGILLMIFTPVPYMDATSSWRFRNRWQRVLVGAAGMIVEIFVAALAAVVWASTAPGAVHSLAYNMMFIASVSTLVFNANPLLRFDGYYILSDLAGIPNLAQRSNQQLRHLFERHLFGVKKSESPASSGREAWWLGVFGVGSGIYRVVVFAGVLLLVADRFLILGILMALLCAVSWVTVPTVKFIKYLGSSTRLDRVRGRAITATLALAAVVLILLAIIPFPYHFRAPGVLQAQHRTVISPAVGGVIERVEVASGTAVAEGALLVRLRSSELILELEDQRARRDEIQARIQDARIRATENLRPLQSQLDAIGERLAKLHRDQDALEVRAPHAGLWIAPGIGDFVGRRLQRGAPLGLLVDTHAFEFVATIGQADADAAFSRRPGGGEVRLHGQAGDVLRASQWRVVSGGKQDLPSTALGWAAGGEVPVSPRDPSRASEPFFEVHALVPFVDGVAYFHGRSGRIRFDLAPEPLLPRWTRRLWQLLQRRYGL